MAVNQMARSTIDYHWPQKPKLSNRSLDQLSLLFWVLAVIVWICQYLRRRNDSMTNNAAAPHKSPQPIAKRLMNPHKNTCEPKHRAGQYGNANGPWPSRISPCRPTRLAPIPGDEQNKACRQMIEHLHDS
ncbi:MAG: hypothetical protein ACK5XN_21700 [Bacteroidota bacterium]